MGNKQSSLMTGLVLVSSHRQVEGFVVAPSRTKGGFVSTSSAGSSRFLYLDPSGGDDDHGSGAAGARYDGMSPMGSNGVAFTVPGTPPSVLGDQSMIKNNGRTPLEDDEDTQQEPENNKTQNATVHRALLETRLDLESRTKQEESSTPQSTGPESSSDEAVTPSREDLQLMLAELAFDTSSDTPKNTQATSWKTIINMKVDVGVETSYKTFLDETASRKVEEGVYKKGPRNPLSPILHFFNPSKVDGAASRRDVKSQEDWPSFSFRRSMLAKRFETKENSHVKEPSQAVPTNNTPAKEEDKAELFQRALLAARLQLEEKEHKQILSRVEESLHRALLEKRLEIEMLSPRSEDSVPDHIESDKGTSDSHFVTNEVKVKVAPSQADLQLMLTEIAQETAALEKASQEMRLKMTQAKQQARSGDDSERFQRALLSTRLQLEERRRKQLLSHQEELLHRAPLHNRLEIESVPGQSNDTDLHHVGSDKSTTGLSSIGNEYTYTAQLSKEDLQSMLMEISMETAALEKSSQEIRLQLESVALKSPPASKHLQSEGLSRDDLQRMLTEIASEAAVLEKASQGIRHQVEAEDETKDNEAAASKKGPTSFAFDNVRDANLPRAAVEKTLAEIAVETAALEKSSHEMRLLIDSVGELGSKTAVDTPPNYIQGAELHNERDTIDDLEESNKLYSRANDQASNSQPTLDLESGNQVQGVFASMLEARRSEMMFRTPKDEVEVSLVGNPSLAQEGKVEPTIDLKAANEMESALTSILEARRSELMSRMTASLSQVSIFKKVINMTVDKEVKTPKKAVLDVSHADATKTATKKNRNPLSPIFHFLNPAKATRAKKSEDKWPSVSFRQLLLAERFEMETKVASLHHDGESAAAESKEATGIDEAEVFQRALLSTRLQLEEQERQQVLAREEELLHRALLTTRLELEQASRQSEDESSNLVMTSEIENINEEAYEEALKMNEAELFQRALLSARLQLEGREYKRVLAREEELLHRSLLQKRLEIESTSKTSSPVEEGAITADSSSPTAGTLITSAADLQLMLADLSYDTSALDKSIKQVRLRMEAAGVSTLKQNRVPTLADVIPDSGSVYCAAQGEVVSGVVVPDARDAQEHASHVAGGVSDAEEEDNGKIKQGSRFKPTLDLESGNQVQGVFASMLEARRSEMMFRTPKDEVEVSLVGNPSLAQEGKVEPTIDLKAANEMESALTSILEARRSELMSRMTASLSQVSIFKKVINMTVDKEVKTPKKAVLDVSHADATKTATKKNRNPLSPIFHFLNPAKATRAKKSEDKWPSVSFRQLLLAERFEMETKVASLHHDGESAAAESKEATGIDEAEVFQRALLSTRLQLEEQERQQVLAREEELLHRALLTTRLELEQASRQSEDESSNLVMTSEIENINEEAYEEALKMNEAELFQRALLSARLQLEGREYKRVLAREEELLHRSLLQKRLDMDSVPQLSVDGAFSPLKSAVRNVESASAKEDVRAFSPSQADLQRMLTENSLETAALDLSSKDMRRRIEATIGSTSKQKTVSPLEDATQKPESHNFHFLRHEARPKSIIDLEAGKEGLGSFTIMMEARRSEMEARSEVPSMAAETESAAEIAEEARSVRNLEGGEELHGAIISTLNAPRSGISSRSTPNSLQGKTSSWRSVINMTVDETVETPNRFIMDEKNAEIDGKTGKKRGPSTLSPIFHFFNPAAVDTKDKHSAWPTVAFQQSLLAKRLDIEGKEGGAGEKAREASTAGESGDIWPSPSFRQALLGSHIAYEARTKDNLQADKVVEVVEDPSYTKILNAWLGPREGLRREKIPEEGPISNADQHQTSGGTENSVENSDEVEEKVASSERTLERSFFAFVEAQLEKLNHLPEIRSASAQEETALIKKEKNPSYWETVSPSEISDGLIHAFTPEKGIVQLKETKDLETLGFLVSRFCWGVIRGGSAAVFGVAAIANKTPPDDAIRAAAESTRSFVSSFTAMAALGWKSGERFPEFLEKVKMLQKESERAIERAREHNRLLEKARKVLEEERCAEELRQEVERIAEAKRKEEEESFAAAGQALQELREQAKEAKTRALFEIKRRADDRNQREYFLTASHPGIERNQHDRVVVFENELN